LARRRDKLIDKGVIGRTRDASLTQANIVGVAEKLLIVGTDVEHDRQAELRVNSGASGIERELSYWNAHAVSAEVTETEDPFTVGHDDELGRIRPIAEDFRDIAAVIGGNEQAAWPLENQSI